MVAWGAMLHRTLEAAETLSGEDGVEAEVFDLATLAPLDTDSLAQSVRRTGRLVVVHEAPMSYGPAGEIAQRIAEAAFLWLEAPVERVTGWDTMVPYFAREQHYMPDAPRILDGARACLSF
jgi:pyruvate dehydrogenase E1 component beta subunit